MSRTQDFYQSQPHFPSLEGPAAAIDGDFSLDWIEQLYEAPRPRNPTLSVATPKEPAGTLPELPPGPWRSLGKYLDYSKWPDRDRFIALDRALLASRTETKRD